jgi:tetratricopeptide (TPR) repeat protein
MKNKIDYNEYVRNAKDYREKGDLYKALDIYDELIQMYPTIVRAYNYKADTLGKLGQNEEAIKCCDQAINAGCADDLTYNWKGVMFYNLGQYPEAIKCYDAGIQYNDKFMLPYLYSNKGLVLSDNGNYKEAIKFFDLALSINPYSSSTMGLKAQTLIALENYEESLDLLNKALSIDKNNSPFLCERGKLYHNMGMNDCASRDFKDAYLLMKNHQYGESSGGLIDKAKKIMKQLSTYNLLSNDLAIVYNTMKDNESGLNKSEIDKSKAIIEKALQNQVVSAIDSVNKNKEISAINTEEIIKKLVADNQDMKAQNQFLMDMIMQLNARLEKVEKNEQKLYCVTEVIYDNDLLNHPELLKLSVKEFGMSRVLDMSKNLSFELVSEAIEQNSAELLLAGCISLDCPDII